MESNETAGPESSQRGARQHTNRQGADGDRPGSPVICWTLRLLSASVLGVTSYLAWHALRAGEVAGCGDGSTWDCGLVLHSRWSTWLGVPVSVPAVLLYATMLAACCCIGPKATSGLRRIAWSTVTALSVMAAGAAIWFTALQWFVIGGLCVYCVAAHAGAVIIATIVLCARPMAKRARLRLSSVGAVGLSVLIAGQLLVEPPPSYEVEDYADAPAEPASEGDDSFLLGPVDGSEVLSLDAPPAESYDSDVAGDTAPHETELPDARASQATSQEPDASSQPASGPFGRDLDLISGNGTLRWPVPSLSPMPDEQPDANVSEEQSEEQPEPNVNKQQTSPRPSRVITVLNGRARLDIYGRPIIGSPEAKHVLIELFDYTCPHCRKMHECMKVAQQRYGDQLSLVTLPLPLNARCNSAITSTSYKHRDACELARYSLAVWRRNRKVYPHYHDWLFQTYNARSAAEARAKAAELIGQEALSQELASGVLDVYLKQHAILYQRASRGPIPKLMSPQFTVKGQPNSAEALCGILQRRLQLQRQDR